MWYEWWQNKGKFQDRDIFHPLFCHHSYHFFFLYFSSTGMRPYLFWIVNHPLLEPRFVYQNGSLISMSPEIVIPDSLHKVLRAGSDIENFSRFQSRSVRGCTFISSAILSILKPNLFFMFKINSLCLPGLKTTLCE